MNSIRFARLAACSALVAGTLAACGDDDFVGPDGQPVRSGTVVVRLNSASAATALDVAGLPFAADGNGNGSSSRMRIDSVQKVEVFVVRIDGKREDADSAASDSTTSDADRNRGGWQVLAEPKAKIDLLALRDSTGLKLGEAKLAAGTYKGFRLIIDPAQSSVTLKDGTVLTGTSNPGVKFPSADRSGIKIQLRDDVKVGGDSTTAFRISFDVSESFQMRGPNMKNGLIFKPVLRATTRVATPADTATAKP